MQWTIDPRDLASPEVSVEAVEVYEARVIVRLSRRMFSVPSSTTRDRWPDRLTPWDIRYNVILTVPPPPDPGEAPEPWKAVCQCPAISKCKHGYAAALELRRLDGLTIPDPHVVPQPSRLRKTTRSRLTVIPGGRT